MRPYSEIRSPLSAFRNLLRNRSGAVAVMAAFMLPIMIAMIGLVVEFGQGLLVKSENQRIADAAAYAGALAYNASSSTTTMNLAAQSVAIMNGIPKADVAASLVTSPSGDGNNAVDVTISSTDVLVLAPVLNDMPGKSKNSFNVSSSLPVSSSSYAELSAQTTGCIIALNSSGTGVTLEGGTSVTADSCSVASNATISVPCGTTLTTKKVAYDSSSAPNEPCTGIEAPSGSSVQIIKQATTNPLSSNTEVTTSTAVLTTVDKISDPSASSGTAVTFESYGGVTGLPTGCSVTPSTQISPPYTVVCTTGKTYDFGAITLDGGVTATIENTGTSVNTYNIATGSCNGGSYSICGGGGTALTFEGPSDFVLPGGIYVGGGSTVTLATQTTTGAAVDDDSYDIGYNSGTSGDYAINVGGGGSLIFGNAEGAADTFTVNGNITSGGGSCLWLPAAAEHDINGYITPSGAISLADDTSENNIYTIADYIWFGSDGGGDSACNGQTFGVQGVNVTLVLGGADIPTTGTCGGYAFCVAAGYNEVDLTAPTSGATEDLAVIGPTSVAAGAYFTEGSSGTTISGAFYFPDGPIVLDGAGSVSSAGCLELIGTEITLSGGSTAASACTGLSSSSSSTVKLVQ